MKFIWDSVLTGIIGDEMVKAVSMKNLKTGEESELSTDGVFIFIGHRPNTQLFQGQLEIDAKGYLVVDEKMRTSVEGVFAAGEVMDSVYRQVVTSAGMGAAAAIEATRYLSEKD